MSNEAPCKQMRILQVTATKPSYCEQVNIRLSTILAQTGFVCNAPVQAIAEKDGFTLTLHEHSRTHETGKTIHVKTYGSRLRLNVYFSKKFLPTGLKAGDFLAAKFEHGTITARKLPDANKYYIIGEEAHSPYLLMSGAILPDAGFEADAISTVSVVNNELTIRLWDQQATDYPEIVKFARSRKLQIIQPYQSQEVRLKIPPYLLDAVGFEPGDFAGVSTHHATIKMFKADLQSLGF